MLYKRILSNCNLWMELKTGVWLHYGIVISAAFNNTVTVPGSDTGERRKNGTKI